MIFLKAVFVLNRYVWFVVGSTSAIWSIRKCLEADMSDLNVEESDSMTLV